MFDAGRVLTLAPSARLNKLNAVDPSETGIFIESGYRSSEEDGSGN